MFFVFLHVKIVLLDHVIYFPQVHLAPQHEDTFCSWIKNILLIREYYMNVYT